MERRTIRERIAEAAGRFERLEVAIFTSFNLNADFFEQNVLPALFGAEESEPRSAREQRVHKALARTKVGVFYDPSQLRPSLAAYRYAAYPVFMERRLFHPKNVILYGKDAEGRAWIYFAALSANLTLSGWGRNCEGLADTWIHAQTEQAAIAVHEFVQWLGQRSRAGKDGVIGAALNFFGGLQGRRHWTDPEGADPATRRSVRIYFSPQHASLWSFLRAQYGRIDGVWAASPYWGDCSRIADELEGLPLTLVASRGPNDFRRSGLGEDVLAQLRERVTLADEIWTWPIEQDRFFHVKLYEVQTPRGDVTGLGSCNFTARGQFWEPSDAGDPGGNVESMLFALGSSDWPCEELPHREIPSTSCDEAPLPLPAYVHVQYNWKDGTYSWQLEGRCEVELRLPDGGPPVRLSATLRSGKRAGELRSRLFRFRVGDHTFYGTIAELSLEQSAYAYGSRLSHADILESWHAGVVAEPLPRGRKANSGDVEGDDEDVSELPDVESSVPSFDWFMFFRGLAAVRGALQADSRPDQPLDLLVARSDSVVALATSVLESRLPTAARWIVTSECLRLLGPWQRDVPAVRGHVRKLRTVADQLHKALAAELSALEEVRRRGADAIAIVEWYAGRLGTNQ